MAIEDQTFESLTLDMTRDGSDVTVTNCVVHGTLAVTGGGGVNITLTAGRVPLVPGGSLEGQ